MLLEKLSAIQHTDSCLPLLVLAATSALQRAIEQRVSLLLLSSLVIVFGGRTPCVRILRGAGQYAKPRSKPTEIVEGKEVLSFRQVTTFSPEVPVISKPLIDSYLYTHRGENVNGIGLDERTPDPDRLVQWVELLSFQVSSAS
jgi:3-deoxy-7-phosphoheptulonate synthase